MDLRVLGPLQVRVGGETVDVPGAKERTLLSRLVADAGRTVPTDELIVALWGDDPPRSAGKSLHTFVLRLRNVLEPDRRGAPRVLVTEPSGYRLAAPADAVDAHRFAQLVEAGRRALTDGRPEEAHRTLCAALGLWRGPAFAGNEHTAFGAREAARLEELRLVAVEDRLAASLELGEARGVVADLERLVADHPYRERAWALLMTALYRSDRQSDALAAYERVRHVLSGELGVDPGPALRTLHSRVLAQDPALQAAPVRRTGGELPDSLRRAVGSGPATGPLEAPLARAREHLRTALAGGAGEVVLTGRPGSGRHRVVLALAEQVVAAGGEVVHVVAHPGGARPLGPVGAPGTVVVVDPGADVLVAAGAIVVRLLDETEAGQGLPGAAGVDAVQVGALGVADVRQVLLDHALGEVEQEALADAVRQALTATSGLSVKVHDWAHAWSRRLVSAEVTRAAVQASVSSSVLQAARDDIRDGVEALRAGAVRGAATDPGRCPWPGLLAYDVDDADRFAGRERLVAECVARLAAPGVLGVVGASGSGKSSLVRAGVLAALADGALPGSESWAPLLMRPGQHPMTELTKAALGAATRPVGVGDLVGRLLDTGGVGTRTLLVVDQAEELWTTCDDPGERAAFLDALVGLTTDPGTGTPGAVSVVLVVRADYVTELTARPTLATAIADCSVLVGPPTGPEVRRAVELPAARAGLALDVGLVDALAQDAGEEPGVLPMLSTALQGLWQDRRGARLRLADYVAAGALSGAVARLAESTWQRLEPSRQDTVRVLLTRLAGPGAGDAVTRRRVPLAELAALSRPDLDDVAQVLVQARLCTLDGGHLEVAHEALFREWPRLRGWLAEDAGAQQVLRRLTVAAAEWDADGRDPAALWRGARLQAAADAVAEHRDLVTGVERDFVVSGTDAVDQERRDAEDRAAHAQRANRRLRGLLGGLAAMLVVALAAGTVAVVSARRAADARVAADAKRLAATAVNEDYLDRALLSAVEAVRTEQAPETYGALLTLLSGVPELVTTIRSPDRFLAAGTDTDRGTVYLGENVNRLRAVTPDGEQLWVAETLSQPGSATGTPDGTAVVVQDGVDAVVLRGLDAATGHEVWTMTSEALGEQWLGPDLAWLPGGELVAGGGDDIKVIDVDVLAVTRTIPWPAGSDVGRMVSLGDGRLLVEAVGPPLADGTARPLGLVDTATGDVTATTLVGRVLDVTDDHTRLLLARDVDGSTATDLVVVGTADLRPLAPTARVAGHADAAAFSPDGSVLAVGTEDLVTLHDPGTALPSERVLRGHSGKVMGIQFDAGGDRLWTAGRDGAAMLWDLAGAAGLSVMSTTEVPGYRGDVSTDGTVGVVSRWHDDRFNEARLVDPRTGDDLLDEELAAPDGCLCQVWAVAMTPDGSTAIGGMQVWGGTTEEPQRPRPDDPGRLVLWDTDDGGVSAVVDLPWAPQGVDVTPDGRTAVVNGTRGWASVDLVSHDVIAEHADTEVVETELTGTAAVSPDGRRAALLRGARVVVVDLPGGEVARDQLVQAEEALWTVEWSTDGATLLTGGFTGAVHALDADDLSPLVPPRMVNAGWVMSLVVSPDGALAASLGTDGDVLLWDTTTWQPLGTPVADNRGWGWLRFSPDGRLVAAYEDGDVQSWPTDPRTWVDVACRSAGRDLDAAEWGSVHPGTPWRSTCGYASAAG